MSLVLAGIAAEGFVGYFFAKRFVINLINELKGDVPAALELLGKGMGKSIHARNAAEASTVARLDKGLSERMLNDFLDSQSPWAKMLLDYGKESIPYLQEHPELITQIIPMAQQFFGNRSGMPGNPSNRSEQKLGLQP